MKSVLSNKEEFNYKPTVNLTNTLTYSFLEWFIESGGVEKCIKSLNFCEYGEKEYELYPHLTAKLIEMGIIR